MSKKVNLKIDQGTTFSATVELLDDFDDPLVVTDLTARGQLRKHYSSNTATDFTCALELGQLTISLDTEQTRLLEPQRYVYDVKITDNVANTVIRVIEGFALVTPQVTKP